MVSPAVAPPRAEAGPDLIGQVGQPVILNGQATTGGLAGFRWIQTAGPPVRLRMEEGPRLVFLPEHEGMYRFALIVARNSRVSEPDEVVIHVRSSGERPTLPPTAGTIRTGAGVEHAGPGPLDLQIRDALLVIPDGARVAPTLAAAFTQAAERMDLYASYDEVLSELSRRIGPMLPDDPIRRQDWDIRLFQPLSIRLVASLREVDLDLTAPEGRQQPLTQPQRERLAGLFQSFAAGARAVAAIAQR
jgi:hypothetical protein